LEDLCRKKYRTVVLKELSLFRVDNGTRGKLCSLRISSKEILKEKDWLEGAAVCLVRTLCSIKQMTNKKDVENQPRL
jgi:hypothetical protein